MWKIQLIYLHAEKIESREWFKPEETPRLPVGITINFTNEHNPLQHPQWWSHHHHHDDMTRAEPIPSFETPMHSHCHIVLSSPGYWCTDCHCSWESYLRWVYLWKWSHHHDVTIAELIPTCLFELMHIAMLCRAFRLLVSYGESSSLRCPERISAPMRCLRVLSFSLIWSSPASSLLKVSTASATVLWYDTKKSWLHRGTAWYYFSLWGQELLEGVWQSFWLVNDALLCDAEKIMPILADTPRLYLGNRWHDTPKENANRCR